VDINSATFGNASSDGMRHEERKSGFLGIPGVSKRQDPSKSRTVLFPFFFAMMAIFFQLENNMTL